MMSTFDDFNNLRGNTGFFEGVWFSENQGVVE